MTLTREQIKAACNGPGGWNSDQLRILGVSWPPKKGWMHKAIRKEITPEEYELFKRLRGVKKKKRKEIYTSLLF